MDIHQLKTFVTVAREHSITRASEILHLSQPAVSAHIKAIEDELALPLFERTPRGMNLTADGERLLVKAEQTLFAHQELVDEAKRIKGSVSGKFRLGAGSNSDPRAVGRLLTALSERFPEVEVTLKHSTSRDVLTGLRNGTLDAGFYNEPGDPDADLATIEASSFGIHVVAPRGLIESNKPLDWKALGELPWIYPTASACCGQTAETLFKAQKISPKRIISVDREDLTRTLVAAASGIGLLHADTAKGSIARGEVDLIFETSARVRVVFAHLASRAHDPLLKVAASIMRE